MGQRTRFRSLGRAAASVAAVVAVLTSVVSADLAGADSGSPRFAGMTGRVLALAVFRGDLVIGGDFTVEWGGEPLHYLARFSHGAWEPLGTDLDGPVQALVVLQDQLVVGGEFENAGSLPVAHLAVWNGSEWSSLGNGTNGPVYALRTQADLILYVGGAFTEAGGQHIRSVARWVAGTWGALGGGLHGQVNALEFFNGGLVAGGDFTLSPVDPHSKNLARLVGNEWQPLARGIDGPVFALTTWNAMLVAGGAFKRIDFVTPTHHVAGYTSDAWAAVGFGFGELDSLDTSEVHALCGQSGALIAGGDFTLADLRATNRIARFDGSDWWSMGTGTDGLVEAICSEGGVVYAGGGFANAGGTASGPVAGYTGVDWLPLSAVPVAVENFRARATPGGVELRWMLSSEAVAALQGVVVERAPEASGTWTARTATPLAPESDMSFLDTDAVEGEAAWFYRLVLLDTDGSRYTHGPVEVLAARTRTALLQPYEPGPGSPVELAYRTDGAAPVQLVVFDVRGRILRQWDAGRRPAGLHVLEWDRRDAAGRCAPRGVYFVRLQAGALQEAQKLVLKYD